jgi:predicted SAM-dependent methyltransferase
MSLNQVRKLQIGSGSNYLDGWLNTDIRPTGRIVYLDATKPFPFPNDSFDFVFAEHLIEHLTFPDGLKMLKECFRVLKPSGTIRVATPNLQFLVELYRNDRSSLQEFYIRYGSENYLPGHPMKSYPISSVALVINNVFRNWGHQIIYDLETISCSLTSAGFVNIEKKEMNSSSFEQLRGIEFAGGPDPEHHLYNKLETFVVEAQKP